MTYIRAFVPLKHPTCARRQMLEALTAKQRHSMYFTLARRFITALRDVPMVRDTAHLQHRGVTLVPDRRHVGTNALVCTPADAIRLRFGPNSFAEHLRTAREQSLVARVFESSELALDIDEPEDLEAWRGYDSPTYVGDQRENTPLAGSRGCLSGNRIDVIRAG